MTEAIAPLNPQAEAWLIAQQEQIPLVAIALGFTETALIPGISAAGLTPEDRRYTALADAEFLYNGPQGQPYHPLPPLQAGLSPTLLSRACLEALGSPLYLFDTGLPESLVVPHLRVGDRPAACLSQGKALPLDQVKQLWQAGWNWGQRLAAASAGYVLIGECVVGGTTTALALLLGLGVAARGRVNSSHPICNHAQKLTIVQQGLQNCPLTDRSDPLAWVAALGDPMQPFVAAAALSASATRGVLLAGGTQMIAVWSLAAAMLEQHRYPGCLDRVAVGTTRWVTEDTTADLAGLLGAIAQRWGQTPALLATRLNFTQSRHDGLRRYEVGYVKEGMAAGGLCIASCLGLGWSLATLCTNIEHQADRYAAWRNQAVP
jgi:uncharacterized protein (TIGR00303 family)